MGLWGQGWLEPSLLCRRLLLLPKGHQTQEGEEVRQTQHLFFFLNIFIGVTLANTITQVSSVPFCNTSSVCGGVTNPSQASSHHHLPPFTVSCPSHPSPLVTTTLCVYQGFYLFLVLLHPFTFFTQPHNPLPSGSCQSVLSV